MEGRIGGSKGDEPDDTGYLTCGKTINPFEADIEGR